MDGKLASQRSHSYKMKLIHLKNMYEQYKTSEKKLKRENENFQAQINDLILQF